MWNCTIDSISCGTIVELTDTQNPCICALAAEKLRYSHQDECVFSELLVKALQGTLWRVVVQSTKRSF